MAERPSNDAVDELRRLSGELERERQRLVDAQAVAKIGSWETDLTTLQVLWSAETFRIFGLDPTTYAPHHESFLSFVHPDDRARVDAAFRASFSTREVCTVEHRVVTADGSERIVEERWRTFTDAEGRPLKAAGTCQDITERRRLESQHLRAQRLESLGTLAGGIAHDLNNVLTPILASVALLRSAESAADRDRILETIEGSAQRGAAMVREVLAFARGRPGERADLDAGQVALEVYRILKETLPRSLITRLERPDGALRFRGDATQLHQVVMNLCLNARDAMPHGGTLTIAIAREELDDARAALHPDARPGSYVRVSVTDTGTGISPAVQERMFEPFFTTKPVGEGSGLGLATVNTIVRNHGGFVSVASEVGRGTRFDAYFPALVETGSAPQQVVPPPELPRRGIGELILVVDDEEGIRFVARRALERSGFRVRTASNGAEGVAAFVELRKEIAAVLTDMTMPQLDGAGMIRAIRALDPDVPIIGSSGMGRGEDEPMPGIGATAWISKPYTADALLLALRRAIDGRTGR